MNEQSSSGAFLNSLFVGQNKNAKIIDAEATTPRLFVDTNLLKAFPFPSEKRKEQKEMVVVANATFGSENDGSERDRWPNRFGFFLAAIGSAVGFGNVWRFPALAKDYGG